ncbi:hypothetical protein PISMIDRAFT_275473 [Pisolithus microcarpus 441]|uniref:Uncharacterized protein n=1 Tax=Pisolithus microcarpus 441 TaxID=765257 RepID=A0A0C9XUX3_9AGAM|nr:hypothetical protein PISMIDRAFT_275473 [Pisolithus microcarpus 441]
MQTNQVEPRRSADCRRVRVHTKGMISCPREGIGMSRGLTSKSRMQGECRRQRRHMAHIGHAVNEETSCNIQARFGAPRTQGPPWCGGAQFTRHTKLCHIQDSRPSKDH